MFAFDNKNEFQVGHRYAEGYYLDVTGVGCKGDCLNKPRTRPEVSNYQSYVGTSAPITLMIG